MVSGNELRELRAEAARRHRAATNKVSRLKVNKGVEMSGTRSDPRRDRERIKGYNRSQLKSYISQLDSFVDRKTQFVPDANRRPVNTSLWKDYKKLESQYNAKVADKFSKVRDIDLPAAGMTVGERMAMMTPKHRQMGSPAVHAPYDPPIRKPTNLASEKALKKLTRDMDKRLKPSYFDRQVTAGRDEFHKMVQHIDAPGLSDKVNKLTKRQFDVLWNYTGFATALSLGYGIAQSLLSDNEQPWHSDVTETAINDAERLADWASTI